MGASPAWTVGRWSSRRQRPLPVVHKKGQSGARAVGRAPRANHPEGYLAACRAPSTADKAQAAAGQEDNPD